MKLQKKKKLITDQNCDNDCHLRLRVAGGAHYLIYFTI